MNSMLDIKSIDEIEVAGKRVLVRCDFNVPMEDGKITNDKRIVAALPTIEYLIKNNARVILCSHLGRPKGKVNEEFSLKPVSKYLTKLLGQDVIMADDVVGPDAQEKSQNLKDGEVMLLENVRFEPGEEKNDETLSKKLASLADIYVNDAFGTAHRAHSSTAGVASFLPSASGFLMEKEIKYIGGALEKPERPMVAILGGAKVSDKIGVIENLAKKVDTIIIGGAMAYTFLKAQGVNIGNSLCEEDKLDLAREILEKTENINFFLPIDSVVSSEFSEDGDIKTTDDSNIPDGYMGVDIGPHTVKLYENVIADAKMIIWNGPMGVFEMDKFANGTYKVAEAVAKATRENGAISIVGGGDSVAAVAKLGISGEMSHISTGGGATLEFLEGKDMPGITSLAK